MSNIIKAHFLEDSKTRMQTEPLFQYDYGQVLDLSEIEGLPAVFEAHFCNKGDASSTAGIGTDGQVTIPDAYLQTGKYIYIYVYLHTGESDGETEYKITVPVAQRASVTHEEPTPVQQSEIEQLIATLEDIIEHGKTGLPENVVRPEDYGAKGDGETDDTEAFRQALDSGKVVFADGTYLFGSESSAGRVIVEKNATLFCTPRTRLIRGDVSGGNQSGFFMVSGTQVAESALTSDASEGSQVISVEDASVFAVGDFVALRNGGTGAELSKRLTTRVREVSGNTVRLENDLQWDYTAENAKLVKYAPLTFRAYGNGAVIDGDEQGKTRSANSQRYGFWLQYNDGSVIEGFRVENSVSGIARLDHCLGCLIDECEGTTPARIDTPYGEFASIAFCTSCIVRGTRTYGYRRSVDWIGAYLCRAERCTASNGGFSAHGYLAKRCTFANCVSDMRNTSAPDDYPKNTVGNETYYFDQEITYDGCTFIDQKYQMQVMRNCSANVIDCEFISTTQDGNGGSIRCASAGAVVRVQGSRFKTKGYCVTVANGTTENPSTAECRDCVFDLVGKSNGKPGFSGYANSRLTLYNCLIRGDAPAISPVDSARPFLKAYGCRFENEPNSAYYAEDIQTIACSGSEYVDCSFTKQAAIAPDATNVSFLNCSVETTPDTLVLEEEPTDRNIRIIGCRHKSALGVQENLPYNILVRDNIQTELPDGTATGTDETDPADIQDGADAAPLMELDVVLSATQDGTGEPSPDNIRKIHGYTGVTIYHAGKDMDDAESDSYDWEQLAGTVYGGTLDAANGTLTLDRNGIVFDGSESGWEAQRAGTEYLYFRIPVTNAVASPRACSHFDPSKSVSPTNLSVGYRVNPDTGHIMIRPPQSLGITTKNDWTAWLAEQYQNGTPVTAWWTLEESIVYDLTAITVLTERGENHIWASDGDVFVRYRRDPQWNVCYVPPGGSQNQVLTKASDDDFDLKWASGGGGGGAVDSVNGQTGEVVLDADDVGAYALPSGGIPKTDLSSDVQTSLGKADTALQSAPVTSVNNKTGAVTLSASDVGAGTYSKPSGGIPASDLASAVQTSLGKADSSYQKPSGGIPAADLASGVIPTVPTASDATPQALGTAAAGSSANYSRADHVHAKPTAADIGAVPSGQGIPSGGNASQVLRKVSATDYDVAWSDMTQVYPSAYCTTAAGTAAKKANCSLWSATANSWLHVLIGAANTAASALTLNVNSTGAVPIYINGTASSATNYTLPSGSYLVFFDGTNFYFRTDGKLTGDITGHAGGDIAAPSSPATGDFLCWNGSAWAATTLAAWQAGSY